jgi:hypothetical protein
MKNKFPLFFHSLLYQAINLFVLKTTNKQFSAFFIPCRNDFSNEEIDFFRSFGKWLLIWSSICGLIVALFDRFVILLDWEILMIFTWLENFIDFYLTSMPTYA